MTNGLPHDIMHDLFEGVVPCEMKLLLSHCVQRKYFTIGELNERIKSFDFPKDNKPTLIDVDLIKKPGNKVKQSASQMMTLCQVLPLIIADKIPKDDENWKSFLVLLNPLGAGSIYICTRALITPRGKHIYMRIALCVQSHFSWLTSLTIATFLYATRYLRGCP